MAVVDALTNQNLTVSLSFAKPEKIPLLTVDGRGPSADELGRVDVRTTKDGLTVPLGAVARVEQVAAWPSLTALDGKPAAILLISRLLDADAGATEKALRKWLAEVAKQFPKGIEARVIGE